MLFCLLATVVNAPLHAQSPKIDSLKEILSQGQDTTQVRALFQLSLAYQYSEPDTAMHYAQDLLALAKTLGDNKGIGDGLITRGRLWRDQGDLSKALNDITASLAIYRQIGDSVQLANALNDISIVYAMSENDEKALEYFEETLELFRATRDAKGESHALNNIGLMHQNAGRLDVAKDYFLRSLRIKQNRQDTLSLPNSYTNLAELFNELGEPEEALRYYLRADSLFRSINDKQGLATTLDAIANFYLQQGKPRLAKAHAYESLQIAQETNILPRVRKASETLAVVSEQLGDYLAAYGYLQLHTTTNDSLLREDQVRQVEELKARFDSEKQANEIVILKQDQQLQQSRLQREREIKYALLGGIVILLLLLIIFGFAYRTNRLHKKLLRIRNQEIERQKEDLQELNRTKDRFFSIISHDIKGPLNTLKGFVFLLSDSAENMTRQEIQEMSSRISESLDNLHQLLENLLTWSMSQLQQQTLTFEAISVYELTEDIFRLYEPSAAKKQLRLANHANVGALVWADGQSVHTVIRNLVANSIKFSYSGTQVTVNTQISGQKVTVRVTDQGTGMDEETVKHLFTLDKKASEVGTANEVGSGFGLVLCEDLVRKNNGHLRVESEVKKGSTFIITLPLARSTEPTRQDQPTAR